MVNENLKAMIENKKPVEEVREIENEIHSVVGDQIPSFEEFMKTYESDGTLNYTDLNGGSVGEVKGYGPCEGSIEFSVYKKGAFRAGNHEASGKIGTIEGNLGGKYIKAEGETSYSAFRIRDHTGDAKFLSASVGGEVNPGSNGYALKGQAGIDVVNLNAGGVKARAGLRVDTGYTIDKDNFDVKLVGFGFTAGDNWGISTPIGGFSINKKTCVVQ